MDLGLKGRVAVVAAASSGLGLACALELAAEGASVVINGRRATELEHAAAAIQSATAADVLPVPGDVTTESDVKRLFDETINRFGKVDVLVTNAGGPPAGYFKDFGLDDFRRAVELNLISIVSMCQKAVPGMRERRWGRIVAITSIAAKQPVENLILSNTARAGALGFLKTLSDQVAADGITVNTVCPGYHVTERLKGLAAKTAKKEGISIDEVYKRLAASVPMRRLGDPREFASAVAFLCSERASYVTGTALQVDGGSSRSLF